jgi:hypothetical protein
MPGIHIRVRKTGDLREDNNDKELYTFTINKDDTLRAVYRHMRAYYKFSRYRMIFLYKKQALPVNFNFSTITSKSMTLSLVVVRKARLLKLETVNLSQEVKTFNVMSDTTTHNFASAVARAYNYPLDIMKIVCNSHYLDIDENLTLEDFYIKNNSKMYVILTLRGS